MKAALPIQRGPLPPRAKRKAPRGVPKSPGGKAAKALKSGEWFVWENAPKNPSTTVSQWKKLFGKPLRCYHDNQGRCIVYCEDEPALPPKAVQAERAAAAATLGKASRKQP